MSGYGCVGSCTMERSCSVESSGINAFELCSLDRLA